MRALIALLAGLFATQALAHDGHMPDGGFPWTFDPIITVPLALLALAHAIGAARLSRKAERGQALLRRRGRLFWAGWAILALALVSPLHAAGERSFLLHMIEHEILMLVATPLLVLARPAAVLLWAFPLRARRRLGRLGAAVAASSLWRGAAGPVGSTAIQAASLWSWHAPALFNRALESQGWHIAQHASFVASALLFWSAMLGRSGARPGHAPRPALAALCLFVTSIVGGALGALMAVSQSPWYGAYALLGEAPFGLSPAEDQQMAGLVMWIPGGMVHALAAILVVSAVLQERRGAADGR